MTLDFNPSGKALIFFKTAVSSDIQKKQCFDISLDRTTIHLIYLYKQKALKNHLHFDAILVSLIFVQEKN